MNQTRRQMLTASVTAAILPAVSSLANAAGRAGDNLQPIATNTYPWQTFARRANVAFSPHSDALLSDIASTGITGYEPIISSTAEFEGLAQRLKTHGLEMRSIYVNSVLHDAAKVDDSMTNAVNIAKEARKLGTNIIVTNPSPIRWGGPEDKTDAQLRLQAESLNALGAELRRLDLTLAYHNHDAELRQGGREFHHMLTATDPDNVKFCLDAHWNYRGCGNSEVAVFDALAHYHHRIVELHLRQSIGGVWAESFSMAGDIDYRRLFDDLTDRSIAPHLVLEQAVEDSTPNEVSVVEAHRLSRGQLTAGIAATSSEPN